MHQCHNSGPFVVHCSAGIGRSGVLMAVDIALARIENGQEEVGVSWNCLGVLWYSKTDC